MEGENITITLTKYPTQNRDEFKPLLEKYFSDYRKEYLDSIRNSLTSKYLLRPLVYHLFSNYDAAVIGITQSEKIAQRLFTEHDDENYLNTQYQIQTGEIIKIDPSFNLQDYFSEIVEVESNYKENTEDIDDDKILLESKYNFTIISNFSVNKGLKLGLGIKLFEKIYKKIDDILRSEKSHFLLTKSNSWFDLSITVFSNDHNWLFSKILEIRSLRLVDIWPDFKKCKDSCLYTLYYSRERVENSHLFVESSSSFGIEYSAFNEDRISDDYEIKTLVEWKVKSGHESEFAYALKELDIFSEKVDYLNGKMDFLVYELNDSLKNNKTIYNALRSPNSQLSKITKQIRTNVLVDYREHIIPEEDFQKKMGTIDEIVDFKSKLSGLRYSPVEIEGVEVKLKGLKVSRHIREKIKKCFSIVNSGLTDHVLFEFYIDFEPWVNRLKDTIHKDLEFIEQLIDVEKVLLNYIEVFDNAYRNRTFNTYLFEDIHDLSVQYNASLIQLISAYNSCLNILTRDYFKDEKEKARLPSFLVNINLNNTVSNDKSVNFHVHDITSPELLFASIHKEIFNFYIYNTTYLPNGLALIRSEQIELLNERLSLRVFDAETTGVYHSRLDRYNILNDLVRLMITFNWDFDLYAFWLWSFNVQNTQLYNSEGFVNEKNMKHELVRFIALKEIAGYSQDYECPIPEFYFYWKRYYSNIQSIVKDELDSVKIRRIKSEVFKGFKLLEGYDTLNSLSIIGNVELNDNIDDLELPNSSNVRIINFRKLNQFCAQECDGNFLTLYFKLRKTDLSLRCTLEYFIYSYLLKLKDEQKSEISILRRNLDTGEPMKSFIKYGKKRNSFYMLDPQGGTFLCDQENLDKYYGYKTDVMKIIWDISLRWKLEYLVGKKNELDGIDIGK